MQTVLISDFNDERFVSAFRVALQEFSINLDNFDKYIKEFNTAGNIFAYVLVNSEKQSVALIQFQKTELSNQYVKEELGLIRDFWIASEYRKQGCGSVLLNAAEEYFLKNNINSVVLFSRPETEGFYQKQGYKKRTSMTACNGMPVYEKDIFTLNMR